MGELPVSVIVPVYNGEKYLAEALHSIFDQHYHSLEVIVVDDGSTDRSAAVARQFSGVCYMHQPNQGVAAARNAGLAAAQGAIITFLDQDDIWMPHKLEIQVAHLRQHPAVDGVGGKAERFLERGLEKPSWVQDRWLERAIVDHALGVLALRREVFERIGPFDLQFALTSDVDWVARARDGGVLLDVLTAVFLRRRVHETNESNKAKELDTELLRVLRSSVSRKGISYRDAR